MELENERKPKVVLETDVLIPSGERSEAFSDISVGHAPRRQSPKCSEAVASSGKQVFYVERSSSSPLGALILLVW